MRTTARLITAATILICSSSVASAQACSPGWMGVGIALCGYKAANGLYQSEMNRQGRGPVAPIGTPQFFRDVRGNVPLNWDTMSKMTGGFITGPRPNLLGTGRRR